MLDATGTPSGELSETEFAVAPSGRFALGAHYAALPDGLRAFASFCRIRASAVLPARDDAPTVGVCRLLDGLATEIAIGDVEITRLGAQP